MEKKCSVEWCNRTNKKGWYCTMHYQRIKKNGSPWEYYSSISHYDKCIVEWCNINNRLRKWYCNKHVQRLRKHGDPLKTNSIFWEKRIQNKLYHSYLWIKQRCYNKNSQHYDNYWWRWIIVCERWLWLYWFTNFCEDMWPRPEWTSIDRIDNNWNYEPLNCRRATIYEQSINRRNNRKYIWVYYIKKTKAYQAKLKVNNMIVLQKDFKTEQEAINARKKAEKQYWLS